MIKAQSVHGIELADQLKNVIDVLQLNADPKDPGMAAAPSSRRKRGFDVTDRSGIPKLSLFSDRNGVLRWAYLPAVRDPASRRARRSARRQIGTTAITEVDIKDTPPNEVLAKIARLDDFLTPKRGLRRIQNGQIDPRTCDGIVVAEPTLLFVHGTFSKSDMFLEELGAIAPGQDFLRRAERKYQGNVFAFDHPTLAVSPWINALDLEGALANVTGDIDVICHSRGGLVVAWWLRNAKRNVKNVVFVASPLQGTSLASPAHLRSALDYFANIATAVKITASASSTFLPFMTAVQGLAAIMSGILHAAASTPLADAAVAIVPGLSGQSRVANNFEIDRLIRDKWVSPATFHAVMSNFKPSGDDPIWKFWKFFQNPKDRLLSWGASAIFDDANDLVVDTQSMTKTYRKPGGAGVALPGIEAIASSDVYDFKESRTVHHTNYFRQPETVNFLVKQLQL